MYICRKSFLYNESLGWRLDATYKNHKFHTLHELPENEVWKLQMIWCSESCRITTQWIGFEQGESSNKGALASSNWESNLLHALNIHRRSLQCMYYSRTKFTVQDFRRSLEEYYHTCNQSHISHLGLPNLSAHSRSRPIDSAGGSRRNRWYQEGQTRHSSYHICGNFKVKTWCRWCNASSSAGVYVHLSLA